MNCHFILYSWLRRRIRKQHSRRRQPIIVVQHIPTQQQLTPTSQPQWSLRRISVDARLSKELGEAVGCAFKKYAVDDDDTPATPGNLVDGKPNIYPDTLPYAPPSPDEMYTSTPPPTTLTWIIPRPSTPHPNSMAVPIPRSPAITSVAHIQVDDGSPAPRERRPLPPVPGSFGRGNFDERTCISHRREIQRPRSSAMLHTHITAAEPTPALLLARRYSVDDPLCVERVKGAASNGFGKKSGGRHLENDEYNDVGGGNEVTTLPTCPSPLKKDSTSTKIPVIPPPSPRKDTDRIDADTNNSDTDEANIRVLESYLDGADVTPAGSITEEVTFVRTNVTTSLPSTCTAESSESTTKSHPETHPITWRDIYADEWGSVLSVLIKQARPSQDSDKDSNDEDLELDLPRTEGMEDEKAPWFLDVGVPDLKGGRGPRDDSDPEGKMTVMDGRETVKRELGAAGV
ncbi:uncharacterized protein EV422DRAFT_571951 [Fimicolochytrium jonesii]|uniref:uncharacterized protein n=1 Tax=Fimicolochytrium jonesii TaxID=1396493 RepID=UPI0022FEE29B|nr:uncharacterized protein EV422DRAFT_571951 [Fimicolochytrium jonesii]KAI8816208.1 hypothetical protein EV422DRAFT_571951 [Fimicolochytrium jonesii]